MYKLVALDVDGTLLNSQHELTSRNREVVHWLVQEGIEVVLATGKPFSSIRSLISELHLQRPQVSNGGAVVIDPVTGEVLLKEELPKDAAACVIGELRKHEVTLILANQDGLFSEVRNDDIRYLESFGNLPPVIVNEIDALLLKAPTHLMAIMYGKDDLYKNMYDMLICNHGKSLSIVKSSPYFLEIHRSGTSKGHALSVLAKSMGLDARDILAIGDSPNDLSMFNVAGYSIAMGNAPGWVKERACEVTDTNDKSGLATALEKVFGII